MSRYVRCLICEKYFETGYGKIRKRYCSNACKQKAYRIAHQVFGTKKVRERLDLAADCSFCGKEFTAQHYRQIYCTNACKQAAYRERKRVTSPYDAPTTNATLSLR